jgi:predicted permease
MRRLRAGLLRLFGLVGRRRREQELAAELNSHLEAHIDANLRAGMTREEARRDALLKLGGVIVVTEQTRDRRGLPLLEQLVQDMRYAARTMRTNPGFTTVVVLTLALGIGANAAIFSVVDGVLLNPVPFADPDRLVALYGTSPAANKNSISYPNLLDWQQQTQTLSAIAGWRLDLFTLTTPGDAERLTGGMVSANYFSILGVQPLLGRTFHPDEDRLGAPPVVLIGEGLWKRRFAADPRIVGQSLTLDKQNYTVVGVIPASVGLLGQSDRALYNDVLVPIGQYGDPLFRERGVNNGTLAVGRLKPGVALTQARIELDTIASRLAATYPDSNSSVGINAIPLKEDVSGDLRPIVRLLLAAVGFLLLIACANVANLVLARSTGRTQEFALRLALGAGRGRLIRQILTESILLSLAGGAVGVALAAWTIQPALGLLPSALPGIVHVQINAGVFAFAFGVAVLTGVLFGLMPALKSTRGSLEGALRKGGRGNSSTRHRTQNVFIVAEVALTVVLLVGTGLMLRSLARLWTVSPGFRSRGVLMFITGLSPENASSPEKIRSSLRAINDRLAALPGVQSASVDIGALPFTGSTSLGFWPDGEPRPPRGKAREALFYAVGPEYLETMGIPLVGGRSFTRQDDERATHVVMIDEGFARSVFPQQDPVGKRIHFTGLDDIVEVVGVVGHVKHWGLDADATAKVRSQIYVPYMQLPDRIAPLAANAITVVIRSAVSPVSLLGSIRSAVRAFDSGQTINNARLMDDLIEASLSGRRFSLVVLGAFAVVALLLSLVGIYGVVSYVVGQRTHEIGVRLALGAQGRDILHDVLGGGGRMAAIGIALGLAGAFGLTRLMASLLFGVSATDPLTFGSVAALLLVVTLGACYLPARRAMRVDPMVALRTE